ncbi:hypothetical protein SCLARK_0027 [Spiroplasma clarkii]|uniref:Uncharacterized protein n=1 Tax=Spiroplasma clarkii TaxID=2139 RepID=A0A1Y0KYN9_9MOLU|nr:lipoprotein [Spiroplasma clarkii]ARU90862.1 hypothetical protein SCLARK_0027 [Spiroplasma clarkii]ATX71647.1 hypothetical protein SCLAR_v1c13490 [Spiroplasma clarkii]
MKKLLGLLAATGLVVSTIAPVVACSESGDYLETVTIDGKNAFVFFELKNDKITDDDEKIISGFSAGGEAIKVTSWDSEAGKAKVAVIADPDQDKFDRSKDQTIILDLAIYLSKDISIIEKPSTPVNELEPLEVIGKIKVIIKKLTIERFVDLADLNLNLDLGEIAKNDREKIIDAFKAENPSVIVIQLDVPRISATGAKIRATSFSIAYKGEVQVTFTIKA